MKNCLNNRKVSGDFMKKNIKIILVVLIIFIVLIVFFKIDNSNVKSQKENNINEFNIINIIDFNSNTIANNEYTVNNIVENDEGRTLDKVTMTIKEGTLTKKGATIIIKDENEEPYTYGEFYRIDKKEDGKWKELKPIIDNYAFHEVAYIAKKGVLEMKHDWSIIYGELEKGEYRLVKSQYENGYKYFSVEFNID